MEAKKYKILLVDDDHLSQRMMGLVLSSGGYLYATACNGAEALEAVQSQHFDLILMDLQMPIMDGYEATRRIRALEAGKGQIPIIALTAMMFDDDNQLCLDTGMDGCIIKPFDIAQLYQAIDSFVENSKKSSVAQTKHGMKLEDENSLLNIQAALPRFGNDIQTYREFLQEFLQSLPDRMKQIRTMFDSGDFQSLTKDSHNLKGVAASMGAMQISALAAKLEQHSRNGKSRLIEETLDECDKTVLILKNNAMKMLSRNPDFTDKID